MCKRKRGETMRRWLLVVLSVALAVLVFAPVAAARGGDDGGFDDRGMDDRGVDDNAVASPASSASASTSATSSASASTSPSASPSATATPALPDTGGFASVLALGPLAMLLGGGLLALGIVRRR